MENLLTDLIKFKTTSSNESELFKVIDYVDRYFNNYDVLKRRFENNRKPSIVIQTKNTKKPKIILNGHLDVVPAEDAQFSPRVVDGKIFGRGASDMKGVDAAMIIAFCELLKEKTSLDLALMLTTDEEIGGQNGVNQLLNSEEYSCDIAFVPDSGLNWAICTDEKGFVHLEVEAKGKQAHGSALWLGENAVNKCWKFYRDVRNDFRQKWGKLREDDSWKPTVNMGALHGGDAVNKVPDYANMLLDIRFPAPVTLKEIMNIANYYAKINDVIIKIKISGEQNHTDSDNEYLKEWSKLVKNKKGLVPELYKANGGSDSRYFSAKGIPVLMSMPTASNPHVDNEWVDVVDLQTYKEVLKDWILAIHK